MTEDGASVLNRRQALRRIGAAGAAVWAVPAVQTINMSRAFAQTQMSRPIACSWFRISHGEPTSSGAAGTCGQPISPSDSCLSVFGVMDCSPVLGVPSAPGGAAWSVCLGMGYQVQDVALFDAAGHCWRSPADPADPMIGQLVQSANGTGGWIGWTAGGGCLTVPRSSDGAGGSVDIDHVDVMACPGPAAPVALPSTPPDGSSPTDPATPAGSPSPSGAPGATGATGATGTTGEPPSATPTPQS